MMNSQESIIALLQGDLTDRVAVNRLLESLVGSGEGQDILLKQISLMRKVRALGAGIAPTPAADARIFEEINRIEKGRNAAAGNPQGATDRRSFTSWRIVAGIIAALLVGIGAGHFIGTYQKSVHGERRVHEGEGLPGKDLSGAENPGRPHVPATGSGTSAHSEPAHVPSASPFSSDVSDAATTVKRNPRQVAAEQLRRKPSGSSSSAISASSRPSQFNGPLRVVFPNGSEVLDAGSTVPIRWRGNADSIPVVVQFSSNGGKNWNTIGRNVVGGELRWKVPQLPDNSRCLVRVGEGNPTGLIPVFRQQLPHDTVLNIVSFSPDGRLLAVPDYAGVITIWDVTTWKPVRRLTGHAKSVVQVVFSPDGASLVSTSLDGTARMWDVAEGREKHQTAGKGKVLQVSWVAAYHPDGQTVALGNDDGTVTLWDAVSGNVISTIALHTQAIRSLYYNHDGSSLIACSTDGRAGVFEAKTGAVIQLFAGHDGVANGISMTRDESLVVTCGFDGTVKFWDVATGRLIRAVQYFEGERIGKILLSPDDNILAVGGFGRDMKLVDPKSGEVLETLPIKVNNRTIGAWPVFAPDSRTLAVAHENDLLLWTMTVNSDVSDAAWSVRSP